jgi:hypothetical protein
VASQQLPEPAKPPFAAQWSELDLVEQRFRTSGHVELSEHAVVPSSQNPFVHVPGSHSAQVTKPDFLPQVERAAQRVTAPLQFTSSWPLATASRTWRLTQLTYCPWLPVHGQALLMSART